ncbi:hypothetical protein B0H17DRAFT_868381, partial [Mycena rosella]
RRFGVDARIGEMEAAIRESKVMREALKAVIEPHKALMAPLRRIPDDVLREIFVACLALLDPGDTPLLLACICRHSRSIAHATPLIWSSLH